MAKDNRRNMWKCFLFLILAVFWGYKVVPHKEGPVNAFYCGYHAKYKNAICGPNGNLLIFKPKVKLSVYMP